LKCPWLWGNMSHWYLDGKPKYTIIGANGKERDTTLRDAKKFGYFPSVTTVMDIMDKPGLNVWLQDRVLESALTMTRIFGEPDKAFIARIKQDSKELSTLARDEGVRIHDSLESAFKDRTIDQRYRTICNKVKGSVCEYFGTSDGWIAETSFSHPMGFGGKVDLHNTNIVADFKTKEEFKIGKNGKVVKMAYDEHCMQLAAYAHGLEMPKARLVNIFVDYDGNTIFHEWQEEEIARAWEMFCLILKLWKLTKRY
jgi:hypothetical protein